MDTHYHTSTQPTFDYLSALYVSSLNVSNIKIICFYDSLNTTFVQQYQTPWFQFIKCDLQDPLHSLNILRFTCFLEFLKSTSEISQNDYVFTSDIRDVSLRLNPADHMPSDWKEEENLLFIGEEANVFLGVNHPILQFWFGNLGGKYERWRKEIQAKAPHLTMLNAGIIGGKLKILLQLLEAIEKVKNDPNLKFKLEKKEANVDMAILNYVVLSKFPSTYRTGSPITSFFKKFQYNRTDVWFIHK